MSDKALKEMEDTLKEMIDLLDKKRQEIMVTGGCIHSLKEAASSHSNHVEKIRSELQASATSGKTTPEVANLVLSYVARSSAVINDCIGSYRSRHDIKTGEALAYDNLIKALQKKIEKVTIPEEKKTHDEPAPEFIPTFDSTPVDVSPHDAPPSTSESSTTKKPARRPRPDERQPLGNTVKRLKSIRKNKTKNE